MICLRYKKEIIGANIRDLMKQNKKSRKDIMKACNVTEQAVSNWLNGRRVPNLDDLLVLSFLFNCSINEIIDAERLPAA